MVHAALNKECSPRLAAGAEELRQSALRSAGHGQRIEGSGKIRSQFARATHKFGGHKTASCEGDSLEVNRHGVLQGLVDGLLRLLHRDRGVEDVCPQVGHVDFELAYGL